VIFLASPLQVACIDPQGMGHQHAMS